MHLDGGRIVRMGRLVLVDKRPQVDGLPWNKLPKSFEVAVAARVEYDTCPPHPALCIPRHPVGVAASLGGPLRVGRRKAVEGE